MKKAFLILSIFAFSLTSFAGWVQREQVNSTSTNLWNGYCVVDVDFREESSGHPHVVWTECVEVEGESFYRSMYRTRDEELGWSLISNISMDNAIERLSRKAPPNPHVAVNPNTNKASAAFFQRNRKFYLGEEQACVFYCPPINAMWEEDYGDGIPELHLHPVSGMAKHAKAPFLLYNNCSTLNGYEMDDFMVFWDQHDNWSDYDHEVYYNFRATDIYSQTPVTGWQFVKKAGNVGDYWSGPCDFEPFAVLNNDPESDKFGEIYISTTDYQGYPDCDLILRIYENTADPPDWDFTSATQVDDPRKIRGSSVGYYSYVHENHFYDCVVIAYYQEDLDFPRYSLRYAYSEDGGREFDDPPEIVCWASEARPVIGIDSVPEEDIIYIAYIGYDKQVYVAKKTRTESIWLHTPVVQNDKDHHCVYLKMDPNGTGEYHVVYDEYDASNGESHIYWTKWEYDGDDNYAPFDW